ncbi:methyl-accepting chemotaxis protein [Paracraurococcus ruber]|uniref:methyl-accepting chemotaxis protein n=1 Tax=Paracraurococcus ruber TaxID=77675 RepID=UPI00195FD487|nr:methyl-accepting chemotaxis protein [Paracraurococcus ruber]
MAALLAGGGGLWSLRSLEAERLRTEFQAAGERLDRALEEAGQRMQTIAASTAIRIALIDAVERRSADDAVPLVVESFTVLKRADPSLEVLEVTDAGGRVIARGHNPAQRGDDKSRVTDVAAALSGRVSIGSVVSPTTGLIALGAAVPLERNGRVIGTVKAAMRLDARVARSIGLLAGGEALLFGAGKLTASTVPGVTNETVPEALLTAIRAGTADPVVTTIGQAGRHMALVRPIRDLEGKVAGAVVLALPLAAWDTAERHSLLMIGGAGLLVLLVAVPAALFAAARMAGTLGGLAGAMRRLAAGETGVAIPGRARQDEIGAMATALEQFRDGLMEKQRLEAAAAQERAARERRAAAMERHTAEFSRSVAGVMASLGESASGMRDAARSMADSARQTEGRATNTAGEADTAAANLATVASAAEELAVSVAEISRQVAQAAQVARDAVEAASATDARMKALSSGAERITDVVRLIGDIAGQTNLLALNATIEAARAGEAGKGFAVVAGEVKQLAAQTAKATEEVSSQITGMREATGDATAAMQAVAAAIGRMDEVAAAIAAAVEQQGAATREINVRVQSVSATTGVVAGAMQELSGVARDSGTVSGHVLEAAEAVSKQAGTLRSEVESFIELLRTDEGERRRFERRPVPGDKQAMLTLPDGRTVSLPLKDISAGGVGLASDLPFNAGTAVQVTLPGTPAPVTARVARVEKGLLGLVFTDPKTAARAVDRLFQDLRMAA